MSCNKYKKQIISYLDGELHQDMASEFEAHLNSCESCKIELGRLKMINQLIEDEKSEFKADAFMSTRVLAKINNKEASSSTVGFSLRYLTLATLAAAGIAVGIFIGTLYSSSSTTTDNSTTVQVWDQLADEYMPETDNNPYNLVTITNETTIKP